FRSNRLVGRDAEAAGGQGARGVVGAARAGRRRVAAGRSLTPGPRGVPAGVGVAAGAGRRGGAVLGGDEAPGQDGGGDGGPGGRRGGRRARLGRVQRGDARRAAGGAPRPGHVRAVRDLAGEQRLAADPHAGGGVRRPRPVAGVQERRLLRPRGRGGAAVHAGRAAAVRGG